MTHKDVIDRQIMALAEVHNESKWPNIKGVVCTLQLIKCIACGKTLCEASGEIKKICPKCKNITHVVVTSMGIVDLNHAGLIT